MAAVRMTFFMVLTFELRLSKFDFTKPHLRQNESVTRLRQKNLEKPTSGAVRCLLQMACDLLAKWEGRLEPTKNEVSRGGRSLNLKQRVRGRRETYSGFCGPNLVSTLSSNCREPSCRNVRLREQEQARQPLSRTSLLSSTANPRPQTTCRNSSDCKQGPFP